MVIGCESLDISRRVALFLSPVTEKFAPIRGMRRAEKHDYDGSRQHPQEAEQKKRSPTEGDRSTPVEHLMTCTADAASVSVRT